MGIFSPFCYSPISMPFYVYRSQHDDAFSSNYKQKTKNVSRKSIVPDNEKRYVTVCFFM